MTKIRNRRAGARREGLGVPIVAVVLALLATALCLAPGMQGPFLLDDIRNLQPMGLHGGLDNPETFNRFVWGGGAGPFGRPLALLSFVPNADTWPAPSFAFKATNLALHLVLGALLFFLLLKILRVAGVGAGVAPWLAVFATALWLLHPMQSSNALYVIQRMAQLSAIFIVLAALAWLYGRDLLLQGRTRGAYLWMTGGLVVPGVLGLLSKENIIVLPVFILALMLTVAPIPQQHRSRAWIAWVSLFVAVPTALIGTQLLRYLLGDWGFDKRPYDAWERLSIQGPVLWDYVVNVFLPRVAPTLFYDDWDIRAVTMPMWIRAVAFLCWAVVIALAFWWRRRQSVLALAVFAFWALHLVEAGPVSLEIYFQHRNYLAMAFLLLGAIYGVRLLALRWQVPAPALPAAGSVVLMVFAMMLFQGSQLWGDNRELREHWLDQRPNSLRSHHHLVMRTFMDRDWQQARTRIREARLRIPEASSTVFYEIFYACELGLPVGEPLARLRAAADTDWRRNDTAANLRQLATLIELKGCAGGDVDIAVALAERFRGNPHYQARSEQHKLLAAKFTILRRSGAYETAEAVMRERAQTENSEAFWMEYADFLESRGRYEEAASKVEKASAVSPYRALGRYLADDGPRQARLRAERERLLGLATG